MGRCAQKYALINILRISPVFNAIAEYHCKISGQPVEGFANDVSCEYPFFLINIIFNKADVRCIWARMLKLIQDFYVQLYVLVLQSVFFFNFFATPAR